MHLYVYATGESVKELSASEAKAYLEWLDTDHTHTGAVDGAMFGLPNVTVYAQ